MKNLTFTFMATVLASEARPTKYRRTNITTVTRLLSHWRRTQGLGLSRDFEDVSQQDLRKKVLDRNELESML